MGDRPGISAEYRATIEKGIPWGRVGGQDDLARGAFFLCSDEAEYMTGALMPVPGSPFPAGLIAHGVASDPPGRFLFVANRGASTVSAFVIIASTGALIPVPGSPFPTGGSGPYALVVHPNGQFLYVGNGEDIVVVDRKSLDAVGTIKVPGMIGGGHLIATDSKGNLYIAQTAAGMQKLTFKRSGS